MTSYEITAFHDVPHFSVFTVEAETPEDALALGKKLADTQQSLPCGESDLPLWSEFRVRDPETGQSLASETLMADRCQLLTAIRGLLVCQELHAETLAQATKAAIEAAKAALGVAANEGPDGRGQNN